MKYFAYGMNTNLGEMAHRCPNAQTLGHAILPGYKFAFHQHADVVDSKEDEVNGVLWEITDECLAALDILEGYPQYYTRHTVDVKWRGKTVKAITYQMNPEYQVPATPSPGYFFMVSKGYAQHRVNAQQLHEAYATAKEVDQYSVFL